MPPISPNLITITKKPTKKTPEYLILPKKPNQEFCLNLANFLLFFIKKPVVP